MPDTFSEMEFKLLFEWKVLNITVKITGKYRRAPERTWFPGGNIKLPALTLCMEPKYQILSLLNFR